ncbi:hypothetical protein FHS83_000514 [Rhizomicrobium palustre]|uniref:Uncharacterized protein n=1 Tax=Rhizomicrobium palustre TaxID=189966 RepID=A0A846MV16_9PROT|nr:hypothetical protein [Rhizomicrobium palustre]NIK87196.1 hypothetical protein [Rhizomicrobium palustre]
MGAVPQTSTPLPEGTVPHVQWSSVIAGAIAASGVSFTLLAFGAGIGLSVASTAPTWRDSSAWLWILSGLFLILVALSAFGLGGYIAGRMRSAFRSPSVGEGEFRDGVHGLATWGLAILVTAMLGLAGAAAITPMMAPGGGGQGPAASTSGENIIASELDELFRSARNTNDTAITYQRSEAARILLKSNGHNGVTIDERNHLANVVANRTGMPADLAMSRVDRVIVASQQELHRARVAAVLQAFMIAAGLLLGAAVAWYSAVEGGRDRQRGTLPAWSWGNRATPGSPTPTRL